MQLWTYLLYVFTLVFSDIFQTKLFILRPLQFSQIDLKMENLVWNMSPKHQSKDM
jgi:hypothetical protein